jgi:predicted hydrocarbon binding protein
VNQLRFNDNKGEVSFFGQKMIILRRDVIRIMREALERLVGDQSAPFLSYLASGIGVHEGSIFRESIGSTGEQSRQSLENLVHSALEDTNLGLGKIRIDGLDFDKSSVNIVVSNCFEATENGSSEEPNCIFTSGRPFRQKKSAVCPRAQRSASSRSLSLKQAMDKRLKGQKWT